MKQVFQAGNYVTVPDGTDVSAFLNPTDSTQAGLPRDGLGDFSIASGRVPSGVHSWVHVHPIVTQVTYVVTGVLTVRMKEPEDTDFYDVRVLPGQAVVSEPWTLFQCAMMTPRMRMCSISFRRLTSSTSRAARSRTTTRSLRALPGKS
jgi:hypothetical protein